MPHESLVNLKRDFVVTCPGDLLCLEFPIIWNNRIMILPASQYILEISFVPGTWGPSGIGKPGLSFSSVCPSLRGPAQDPGGVDRDQLKGWKPAEANEFIAQHGIFSQVYCMAGPG